MYQLFQRLGKLGVFLGWLWALDFGIRGLKTETKGKYDWYENKDNGKNLQTYDTIQG